MRAKQSNNHKHNYAIRSKRRRPTPFPIFELTPLEQRLFLSASASPNIAQANYTFDTGSAAPAVPDSPVIGPTGWWVAYGNGVQPDATGLSGAGYLSANDGDTLTLDVGGTGTTNFATGDYTVSFDLNVITDYPESAPPGNFGLTATATPTPVTLLTSAPFASLPPARSGIHINGNEVVSYCEYPTDSVYAFHADFHYETGAQIELNFKVTGLEALPVASAWLPQRTGADLGPRQPRRRSAGRHMQLQLGGRERPARHLRPRGLLQQLRHVREYEPRYLRQLAGRPGLL